MPEQAAILDPFEVLTRLCDHYRSEPFAEKVLLIATSAGKREQSEILLRSTPASEGESPQLLVEAGPLFIVITPEAIVAVPAGRGNQRPIYWATPVLVPPPGGGAKPKVAALPTPTEVARLIAPLPLPQLALMQPDAAAKLSSAAGFDLLARLPAARALRFEKSSRTISGRAGQESGAWSMTLQPGEGAISSFDAAWPPGTALQLNVESLEGDASGPGARSARAQGPIVTSNRRRVAELSELARKIGPPLPEARGARSGEPFALGAVALSNAAKLPQTPGSGGPASLSELLAPQSGNVLLLLHRSTLDPHRTALLAADAARIAMEQRLGCTAVSLRLSGAAALRTNPEPILLLNGGQVDRLMADDEAVLAVVGPGPDRAVLGRIGFIDQQVPAKSALDAVAQLLAPE